MESTGIITWGGPSVAGALAVAFVGHHATVSNIIAIGTNKFQFGIKERVPHQLHPDDIHYMDPNYDVLEGKPYQFLVYSTVGLGSWYTHHSENLKTIEDAKKYAKNFLDYLY